MDLTLVIGNKNTSSWSMRPWLVLKQTGLNFKELEIDLHRHDFKQTIAPYSPTQKVPVLHHGELIVWDSLAICEYLAELVPYINLWPKEPNSRALARSVVAEMHSSFASLRKAMPFNAKGKHLTYLSTPEVEADIKRIFQIWTDCRKKFSDDGEFLFGEWSIADAFYTPIVGRFLSYQVMVPEHCKPYMNAAWHTEAAQDWLKSA